MPPLPELLTYENGERLDSEEIYAYIGLLDDPDRQSQEKLKINNYGTELYTDRFCTVRKDKCITDDYPKSCRKLYTGGGKSLHYRFWLHDFAQFCRASSLWWCRVRIR